MSRRFTQSEFFLTKIHPFLSRFPLYDYWLLRRKSYLRNSGWFKSFRSGKSVDLNEHPVPWFTYGVNELLEKRLQKELTVFEYGSGLGTLWWTKRVKSVTAVEHVKSWFDEISEKMPQNVHLLFRELGENYINAISEGEHPFDIIIIDGRERNKCAAAARNHLSKRGVIIFDDTNREKYSEGITLLKESGFRQLPFKGFSPIEFMECETSIFYRDNNVLEI
ncbi:MAG: FkbM family methyltransferase [Balneolaceae bacterium]|nr:MAG: FkbM family methyltransferase [Balneolaceae bacterium]